jgi:hypothetical protein
MVKTLFNLFLFLFLGSGPLEASSSIVKTAPLARSQPQPLRQAQRHLQLQPQDKMILNTARSLYAKAHYSEAIQNYTLIPPSSDFWLEALEEKAWAFTSLKDYEKALAELHSITTPIWAPQVGPETYMLSAFVSLKICAYKDVLKKIDHFKKVMIPRVDSLQALINKPPSEDLWNLIYQIKKPSLNLIGLGKQAEKLPRYFFRDKALISFILQNKKPESLKRLRQLAQNDLDEIELNLKKMKIIDIQVMQKILTQDKNSLITSQNSESQKLQFSKVDRNNTVTFPVSGDNDEVWLDEVGKFQVRTNLCPFSGQEKPTKNNQSNSKNLGAII